MCAIATIALYTTLRRRGTTRQLAAAIVTCVLSALLLLPAIVWYNVRFSMALSVLEIAILLLYVVLWGLCVPLSVTVAYCLFTPPRTSTTSVHIPRQQKGAYGNRAPASLAPPRSHPGMVAPYVYSEDAPWGWLVYHGGRFQGQRLALKRAVVTIGRGEDNDIWLDDELASRHHAELAWDQGLVYVTDCGSLNGVLLQGQRIRGSVLIEQDSLVEIGTHHFLFEKANPPQVNDQDDPLAHHVWHASPDLTFSDVAPFPTPPPRSISGPVPLRLPSKPKHP
jgi:hypothetical protein